MTIVFFSAGLYHHISEIADALYEFYGDTFHFFALDDFIPESIRIMGHEDEMRTRPYYQNVNTSKAVKEAAEYWCKEADVCIIGCGNCEAYLHLRMETHKLTFKMKERLFKKGLTPEGIAHYEKEIADDILKFRHKQLYYLCIGHFSSHDLYQVGIEPEKLLRWGYFVYPSQQTLPDRSYGCETLKLCWAGRFISQKRPELALQMLEHLRKNGVSAELTYIGYGPNEEALKVLVAEKNLEESTTFLGAMPEWKVRAVMREHDWFLFTSTGWEGWGVVLSEAMSEGLLCMATKPAGSSMELIQDGRNGFFLEENFEAAKERCLRIAKRGRSYWRQIGACARRTLEEAWNGERAAACLIAVLQEYEQSGKVEPRENGICSVASIEPYEEYENTIFIEDRLR